MRKIIAIAGFCAALWGCNNIQDSEPASNLTFIKFFHGPHNYESVEVEVLGDGYAILGNMRVSADSSVALILRTDASGNRLETFQLPGTRAKSLEIIKSNGIATGYLVLGDSIKINPSAERVADIEVYSIQLFKLDLSGSIVTRTSIKDTSSNTNRARTDYKASSMTIEQENGSLILLGLLREELASPEKAFVVNFDIDDFNPNWYARYDMLDAGQTDFNYTNSKTIFYDNNNVIWASAILKPTQGFNESYLALPFAEQGSYFRNFSVFGTSLTQFLSAEDIVSAKPATFGYGIIGTRSTTTGDTANVFFVRANQQGSIIEGSDRYFDAVRGQVLRFQSESQDYGESVTATRDGGFVLGGSTRQGSTLADIFLIKVNAYGDFRWSKVIGGIGNESVSSIREESNGALVVTGTNTISGLSSIFLIRTNESGEIRN